MWSIGRRFARTCNLPGPSGLDLQKALARTDAALPLIFLTGHAALRRWYAMLTPGERDVMGGVVVPGAEEVQDDRDRLLSGCPSTCRVEVFTRLGSDWQRSSAD